MSRPGTPPYVGSCRECGVVNGHSISCRVDLIVEGITRGLRREGYILIEASHHAELVGELKRARAYLCCSVATTDSTMRPLYSKDDLGERIKAITDLLAKIGGDQ